MRQELFKHSGKFTRVNVQLSERTKLGQGLDIPLQVGRVNKAGLGGEDESLELLV